MKKIYKNIIKTFIVLSLIIWFIFLYWYFKKIQRNLVEYNINEQLVVKFIDDDNKYLLNLNNWKLEWIIKEYKKYSYDFIFEENIDYETPEKNIQIYNRLIYNQNNEYYFDYRLWIYNKNKEINYRFMYPWYHEAYWSQDWKYLITKEWFILRMFDLFIPIRSSWQTIAITEPSTWKRIWLIIQDENWKVLEVETILWYVE